MRRWLRRTGAAVAGAATAASSFFLGFGGTEVPRPRPVTIPAEGYVAIGDSYAAGEGLNPYLAGTADPPAGNRCHRSTDAYGPLLAGSSRFTFKACSGALIAHVKREGQKHGGVDVGGPQLDGVVTPGLVTLTVAGNNAGFSDVVKFCAFNLDCLDDDDWNRNGVRTIRDWVPGTLNGIRQELTTLFDELPAARTLIFGYPRLFSVHHISGGQRSCLAYGLFSDNERQELRSLGDQLNLIIARAAFAAGHDYIEVADTFEGHETCGREGQWLQFFGVNLRARSIDPGNFHPTKDGQEMLARLVECYMASHPTQPSEGQLRSIATRGRDAGNLAGLVGQWPVGRRGDAVHQCASSG